MSHTPYLHLITFSPDVEHHYKDDYSSPFLDVIFIYGRFTFSSSEGKDKANHGRG